MGKKWDSITNGIKRVGKDPRVYGLVVNLTGGLNNISLYYSREMNCNIKFYPLCCLEIPDEGRFPNMFYVSLLTITIY